MMPSPYARSHFHPQQGHLDHKPTQCYDISSGKQKYAKRAPNDLLWVMQVTEFRQPLQVQSHLEMSRILVQLGHIQRT